MQDSDIPYKFSTRWAQSAGGSYITTTIPSTAVGGAASQVLGFPPITATPTGAGGIPPNIADFNGVFNYLSAWTQWTQAGGPIYYDSAFSSEIGGYPKASILGNASTVGSIWISTVDNNTSDPDTGGANWLGANLVSPPFLRVIVTTTGAFSGTIPSWANRCSFRITGGGGAGGGGDNVFTGGGGGAAGTAVAWVSVTGGASYSGTIGTGGTCPGGSNSGGNGTSSTLTIAGITYTGAAGNGGTHASAPAGGSGGTATNGDINVGGGAGGDGAPGGPTWGGNGGASFWGGGGRAATASSSVQNGMAFGSGGGAGYNGGVVPGGAGANGICQIEFFA